MKDKNIEKIIIAIVFLIIFILIITFTITETKENTKKDYTSPLTKVTILKNDITLEENKRTYAAVVDCSKYTENEQIISYELANNENVSVESVFYKDNLLLEEPSSNMTNFDIELSVYHNDKEELYHFSLSCQG